MNNMQAVERIKFIVGLILIFLAIYMQYSFF
jgi:hypothetical protein